MSGIIISNDSFHDKDYIKTFSYQEEYVFFGISDSSSTLVPFYIDILRQALGARVDKLHKDLPLSKEETTNIKNLFINQIDETLLLKEAAIPYHFKLLWNDQTYDLNLSLTSPNNRRIRDFYMLYEICKECLEENKPMYLSID